MTNDFQTKKSYEQAEYQQKQRDGQPKVWLQTSSIR